MLRKHHKRTVVSVVGAWLLFVATGAGAFASGDVAAKVDRFALRPVAVEAVGFAPWGEGVNQAEAHSAALADARRNALIQAHAAVQADTIVSNRRVARGVVIVRSAGYVHDIAVLESGVAPGMEPPVYRVRVRALIHPLDQMHAGGAAVLESRLTPVISLRVASETETPLGDLLVEELRRCGISVVDEERAQPVVRAVVQAEAIELSGDGVVWWQGALKNPPASALRVRWTMTTGPDGDAAAPAASGECLLPADVAGMTRVLPHLGVGMAQAGLRLWCAPRVTRVLFPGTTQAEAQALKAAAREIAVRGKERPEASDGETVLDVLVAGSPTVVIGSVLERAGLQGVFVLDQGCLRGLTYVRASAADVADAAAHPKDRGE